VVSVQVAHVAPAAVIAQAEAAERGGFLLSLTCCSAIAQKLMQETTQKLRHPNIIASRIRIVSGKRTRAESATSLVHEILFMTAGSKGARKHGTIHDPVKSRVMYPVCACPCVRGSPRCLWTTVLLPRNLRCVMAL